MFLITFSLLGRDLGSERAYLNGDNLNSDMTRDTLRIRRPFCRQKRGHPGYVVACTASLVNQPAAFDGEIGRGSIPRADCHDEVGHLGGGNHNWIRLLG
jgi:hypothetical protein